MTNRILIIDDDVELCSLVKKCVSQVNLETDMAYNGQTGLLQVMNENDSYSLIILDVMLPNMDGFQVLSEIRKYSNVPVLMLTAKGSEPDKVTGLSLGADDYLTKPFSINELIARVQSLIRRYTTFNSRDSVSILTFKGIVIDKEIRTVHVEDKLIDLTGKEFDLLVFLASNKGRVFTKKQIYTQVWNDDYSFDDNNIMSFISKLRKKIEPNSEQPFYILTVHGVGYRFNKEA
ncbi:DNA-binding response regulator [Paenibacillus glucanolyticus]|jgi:DNA-binding response OmpR family regulator|uniref:response regulator transcription factor n=1 Tax=Paenibacillus TaxID=44249 RepID=UPI0003E27D07|nr:MULTISPECIES: response regulator transcription factor [Paenibacillus]ANA82345.1 DNA-binding response regulator [Paenibacillus glucanolyticus]AVV58915.1 DNA-binding response regulator [Paenibacillus glucanolyticus]ETT33766.1 winged helix family two component transcriptional regulator [Paenibacillus sp. FSL R5-808]MPY17117.1 response regulator transcription factor [Paenibacillus glucanolyticus]